MGRGGGYPHDRPARGRYNQLARYRFAPRPLFAVARTAIPREVLMSPRLSRRDVLRVGLVAGGSALASGCGTILFPERVGQPRCGPLDWKVVALDTVGLLLFFVPGVIAFAVDFYNGTIFLPACQCGQVVDPADDRRLVAVQVPPDELDNARIEQVVEQHAGRRVRLARGRFIARTLDRVEEFWTAREGLLAR
jgi:hypothetical protein